MRGKIVNITQDIFSKGFQITLNVRDTCVQELQLLNKLDDLDVILKKHKEKRSLDANSYAWVLMSKIAEVVKSSKEEIYEEMLLKYGTYAEDENGYIVITVKACVDMSKIEGHWMYINEKDGFKAYIMILGSSQYDTGQMSRFIDGIVSEAKELGIETATPAELQMIKERWGV